MMAWRTLTLTLAAVMCPAIAQVPANAPPAHGGGSIGALGNRVTVIGDSFARAQYTDGAHRQRNAQSFLTWWSDLMGGQIDWAGSFGASGERTDEWLDRLPAAIADPSDMLVITTPVNDIAQGRTGAAAFANVRKIVDAARAAGKLPVVVGCIGAASFSAAQIGERDGYNAKIKAYLDGRGVYVDAPSVVLDGYAPGAPVVFKPGYNFAPGGTPDGVHLSIAGSAALGRAMAALPAFRQLRVRAWPAAMAGAGATQLVGNPVFASKSGGTTLPGGFTSTAGTTAPLGYALTRSGGAAVSEQISFAAKGNGQVLTRTIAFNAPPATASSRLSYSLMSAGLTSGRGYRAFARVHVPAGQAFGGLALMMQWTVGGSTTVVYDMYPLLDGAGPWPTFAHDLVLETPPLAFPSGQATQAEVSLRAYPVEGVTSTATFDVQQIGVMPQ